MRSTRWAAAVILLTAGAATAEPFPYTATIASPEAEVRCGPGDKMYVTNRLRKGDKVRVVGERAGGWLAIEPPPRSFSWVEARFVRPLGRDVWVVEAAEENVPVLVGSEVVSGKPNTVGSRVGTGVLLWSRGATMTADDKSRWVQVGPPPKEVRYIRADAVAATAAAPPAAPAPLPPPPGAPGPAEPGPLAPPGPAPGGDDPRWQQAEEASRAGRHEQAARLYEQLGQALRATSHEQAVKAFNKADEARRRASGPYGLTAGGTGTATDLPAGWTRSPPGVLTPASAPIDGQPAYLLVDSQNRLLVQAVAMPGFSLRDHVNKVLQLEGVLQNRPDLRAYVLTVHRVRQVR